MSIPSRVSYLDSRLVRVGLAVAVLGTLPLLAVIAAAKLGLTADPDPNPVVFGILAMLTFWPGLGLAAVGAVLHHRAGGRARQEGRRR